MAEIYQNASAIGIGSICAITVGIVRVQQHGAAKKDQNIEAMGKSRGGLSTKIHAAVDALGNPVRLRVTAGQTSKYTQAEALIDRGLLNFLWMTILSNIGPCFIAVLYRQYLGRYGRRGGEIVAELCRVFIITR